MKTSIQWVGIEAQENRTNRAKTPKTRAKQQSRELAHLVASRILLMVIDREGSLEDAEEGLQFALEKLLDAVIPFLEDSEELSSLLQEERDTFVDNITDVLTLHLSILQDLINE